jgi:hypothetical protein
LIQIARWLKVRHPTPYPVRLELYHEVKGGHGETALETGPTLVIRINVARCFDLCQMVLLHEWGHAMDWRQPAVEELRAHHNGHWGLSHAEVWESFMDNGGDIESGRF